LRDNKRSLVTGAMQRPQRWHGELGRAGENDLQEGA
jgi:hypothetical protein